MSNADVFQSNYTIVFLIEKNMEYPKGNSKSVTRDRHFRQK